MPNPVINRRILVAKKGMNPLVTAWAIQVVANGGAPPSLLTQQALSNFANGLSTDGLSLIAWSALVPDSLTAALTPQLKGPGLALWAKHNFVAGDLTVNGLAGDGATKWVDTGLVPQTMWGGNLPGNDCGITFYNSTNPGAGGVNVGCDDGTGTQQALFNHGAANTNFDSFNPTVGQGRASAANAGFTGYASANRTATNAAAIYEANSTTPHNTLVSIATGGGSASPGFNISLWAFTNNTGQSLFSNQRMSFVGFHHGFTSAQSAKLYVRIQALRTALGGGFV